MLKNVLDGEGMTFEGFRDAGILCGVESLRGKVSVSSHIAFSWIHYYKTIEGVICSAIVDSSLDIFREEGVLERVRTHYNTCAWDSRIRPDHLERCTAFMNAL